MASESKKEVVVDIKSLSRSCTWARDGFIRIERWKNGNYNIDAQFGSDRAVQQTDRESIIALRDSLTEFLAATEPKLPPEPALHLELSDEAYDQFERNLEQRPMSTNLALQRLLRRKPTWEQ